MQPSQASNDTRLPRAVVRRSAAIAARYAPQPGEQIPNPADANAPANAPAAATAPTADPQPSAPAADPRDTDPAYWKQRFSVTEGLLRTERANLATRTETLHQQIVELKGQLLTLKAQASPTEKIDIAKFFTPEQIVQYGEEQCEAMASTAMKAAKTTAQELIDAAVQPLRDKQERTAATEVETKKQRFTDALAAAVPNWQTIDTDPRWLAWLSEDDENEVQRQSILNVHIANGNATGAARMFKAWEKSVAPAPTPVPPVAPSGSGAAPGSDAPNAPAPLEGGMPQGYPSKGEIKDFYKRAALGKVKDDERVKFEARLAAQH